MNSFKRFTYTALVLATTALSAWSPRFHETQTSLAAQMIPTDMARFLMGHLEALREGARGIPNDQVPSMEAIEDQFRSIVAHSEAQRSPRQIVRELGVLAHMVQLYTDPSATAGMTPLREQFEAYGDEHLNRLVVNREPFWALRSPLDPRPALIQWAETKKERHERIAIQIDAVTGARRGSWDVLSQPFAQLQLSFSNGVNATANFWLLLWRAAGDSWVAPTSSKR